MDTTSRPEQPDTAHSDPAPTTPDAERRPHADVHVIGGGLGGLAAAAVIARSGLTVVVHERRGRLGGRATTDDRGGYRFNQGPHAFYRAGEGAAVLGRLGITPRGVAPEVSVARMVRGGDSFVAPGGISSLVRTRLLGARDKVSLATILARLPKIDPATLATTTAGDWIEGLTDRETVRDVLHSIVRLTTYVNAPSELSADVAALQLQLGLGEGVLYLDGGWQQLVDALAAQPNVHIDAGEPILALDDLAKRDGLAGPADGGPAVIVATGSPSSAATITGHPYVRGLEAAVGALDLGLAGPPEHSFVIGVDEPIYLSDHGVPADMVPAGRASVSLAAYHRVGESTEGHADEARTRLTRFARHAGVTDDDIVEQRYLHRMVTVSSIPTASSGGLGGRPGVAVPDRPGVFVAGDWVGSRGHLADAVLASAEEAAIAAVAHVRRRSAVR